MLRIGPFQFELPVVQAALSGYSDAPMRRLARRFGAPYTLHEVVLDKIVIQPGKLQREILDLHDEDHPVGGQLMGSDPSQFAAAAELMARAGFDVIDVNFGCPVRKVLGRCRGGYLLSDPQRACEILRAVRGAVPRETPVTVKMRRGMDDSAASERDFFRIFDFALELGVDAVTVHGRTVEQKYVGPSRWGFLERVKRHAGERTILGSGDLFNAEDVVRMLHETGVDGVTVARGCIGNPWIFRESAALLAGDPLPDPPTIFEQAAVIREHFGYAAEQYGEETAVKTMRKFGIKYSELHPGGRLVRDAFVRSRGAGEFLSVLEQFYGGEQEWPPVSRKAGPGELIAAGACA